MGVVICAGLWVFTFLGTVIGWQLGGLSKRHATGCAAGFLLPLVIGGWLSYSPSSIPEWMITSWLGWIEGCWYAPFAAALFLLAARQDHERRLRSKSDSTATTKKKNTPSVLPLEMRKRVLYSMLVGMLLVAATVPAVQRWVIGRWVNDIPRKWRGPGGSIVTRIDDDDVVRQSTGYTCAAAACATLLRDISVDANASEEEMVYRCLTKRRGGATTLGMAAGLKAKLTGTAWRLRIYEPDWETFKRLKKPLVCSMEHAKWLGHAVVVRAYDPEKGVHVADPLTGLSWWSEERFRDRFKNEAIVVFQDDPFDE